ncbi:trypsin-like peptidase domain-containing protein [Sinorhizobium meliloti]|uniref:trypsin-like peptidase domain-containing protein n=1 Tax=Rhizobium meliloti TaxID=382 RepID=UPI000FD9B9FF|nr:trypsin-like peptidase domain-containing protein [Sinorhizobium meliloti]RVI86183.1 hypothetical protein CN190_15160 [Sinorhizobium meliloti]
MAAKLDGAWAWMFYRVAPPLRSLLPLTLCLAVIPTLVHASIIGEDTRAAVLDTAVFPNRAIVQIMFTTDGGTKALCSGSMIGPNVVLTVAHCIASGSSGRVYRDFRVIPGRNRDKAPFGRCGAIRALVTDEWSKTGAAEYDLGALILDCSAGDQTGWLGIASPENVVTGARTALTGYAADRAPTGQQWTSEDQVRAIEDNVIYYQNDSYGGTAGAPLIPVDDPTTIIAVHTSGMSGDKLPGSQNNSGIRITAATVAIIEGWVKEASDLAAQMTSKSEIDYETLAANAWENIKDHQSTAELSAFLLRYPKSSFAEIASSQLSELDNAAFIREKIEGSDIERVSLYGENSRLRRESAAVGLLRISFLDLKRQVTCTSFLVRRDYLMTSLACLRGPSGLSPKSANLILDRVELGSGDIEQRYDVDIDPIESDVELDYAILRVHGSPSKAWGSLPLSVADPILGEALTMIHYPGGIEQYVTRGRCRIARGMSKSDKFFHTCDALIGSAGAPILADDGSGAVVGMHIAGFEPLNVGASPNLGVRMRAIVEKSKILNGFVSGSIVDAPIGPAEMDGEEATWRAISDGSSPDQFRAYLSDYPNGKYKDAAEVRIREFETRQARIGQEMGEPIPRFEIGNSVVFIECEGNGNRRYGAGSIVNVKGGILTALHLAPSADYQCWASLGTSAIRPDHKLERRKAYAEADALMLQVIVPFKASVPFKYAELSDQDLASRIVGYGFPEPGRDVTARIGSISNVIPHGVGYIEAGELSLVGMAGAPVLLDKNGPLVGIVVGEKFDVRGQATHWKVMSAEILAGEFSLERNQ